MDVIKFILVFILNRCGICRDTQNEAVSVCGSPFNGGLESGSRIPTARNLMPASRPGLCCLFANRFMGAKRDKAMAKGMDRRPRHPQRRGDKQQPDRVDVG